MIDREFKQLVAHMRLRQKEYFRTRDQFQLLESKKLEKKVDNLIAGVVDLFDNQEEQKKAERKQILVEYEKWKLEAKKDDPDLSKKNVEEVIEMFLFEY